MVYNHEKHKPGRGGNNEEKKHHGIYVLGNNETYKLHIFLPNIIYPNL